MYKKKPPTNSSTQKLLKFLGLAVASLAAVIGIFIGATQMFGNSNIETLAQLGVGDSIAANQKVLAKVPLEYSNPAPFRAKTIKDVVLPEGKKVIALTFDDGPWPQTTENILATLTKENVKATFFVIGQPLKSFPEISKKVVAAGHEMANHTQHHWYKAMHGVVAQREIEDTNKMLLEDLNVKTAYFRPPGGVLTNGLVDYAHQRNDTVLMWSADSGDSNPRRPSAESIIKTVVSQATPGGIVLMHDGGGNHENTAKAVPEIIRQLRAQGYTFATITELLEMGTLSPEGVTSAKKAAPAKTVKPSPAAPAAGAKDNKLPAKTGT
jgi:peptidoglycan-N-acetylglucosamine deacetylase